MAALSSLGRLSCLVKPAAFTAAFCGTCFCTAAIVQHQNRRNQAGWLSAQTWQQQLVRPRDFGYHHQQQQQHRPSGSVGAKIADLRYRFDNWKKSLSTGQKLAAATILINLAVLGAWRVGALRPAMERFFLCKSVPPKIALSPMILSCFSHSMPLHLAVNMYALYSFSGHANALLGPEQLVGLFLSAGAVSSLLSVAVRVGRRSLTPSLGASGALLGVIAYICVRNPETNLLLFFIPITAGKAIVTIMAVDALGLLAKWRYIDHAAHLGGSLFGVWYAHYGQQLYLRHRAAVARAWLRLTQQKG